MSEPFLGEIRLMSFTFAPRSWASCNGQILPINQNQALFSLLGTTYGGDGRVSFALPDLRARAPMHVGAGYALGQQGGEAVHALIPAEMPSHAHAVAGTASPATTRFAGPTVGLAESTGSAAYGPPAAVVPMAADALAPTGGNQPHENRQPYLAMGYCIALVGIFPSRD
ncbi:MAG: tail fiber protein [Ornithinibacter sp.]